VALYPFRLGVVKKSLKWFFGCIAAVLLLAILFLGSVLLARPLPEFDSPSTSSRDTPGYRGGSLGILEKASRKPESGLPVSFEFATPNWTEGSDDDFLVEWLGEEELEDEDLPKAWVDALEGDEQIELAAFATWHPQPGDDVDKGATWQPEAVFYDAKTLALLGEADLERMGVPLEWKVFERSDRYRVPKMRLLFRTKNVAHPRMLRLTVGDAVTGAQVSYSVGSTGQELPECDSAGQWLRFDVALLLWHSTPLTIYATVLTGEPLRYEIRRKNGAQVVMGDRVRMQWLREFDHALEVNYRPRGFTPAEPLGEEVAAGVAERLDSRSAPFSADDPFGALHGPSSSLVSEEKDPQPGKATPLVAEWIQNDPDGKIGRRALLRVSCSDYVEEHVGVQNPDGTVDWEWASDSGERIETVETTSVLPSGEPLRLFEIPHRTELEFEIPGVPGAPSQSAPANLMHVAIPRLTLPLADADGAEDRIIGVLSAAAQIEWEHENLWDDYPAEFPGDGTFRDVTPEELLHWYLRHTKGSMIEYDPIELTFDINPERQTFFDKVKEKWDEWYPF